MNKLEGKIFIDYVKSMLNEVEGLDYELMKLLFSEHIIGYQIIKDTIDIDDFMDFINEEGEWGNAYL